MLVTTTPTIEGGRITRYYGIVSGETIIGANVFRDFFASIRDVVGGRDARTCQCYGCQCRDWCRLGL